MIRGGVKSDREAFERIRGRLQNDVGSILRLVKEDHAKHSKTNGTPYWAFVRMTFPVAEALGDLLHQSSSTSHNLTSILKNEFEMVRPGYKGKAATIAQIYRHSLIHTDELRTLVVGKRKKVKWRISCFEEDTHLRAESESRFVLRLCFDVTAFYDDLLKVCDGAIAKRWNRKVKNRYNTWLVLKLSSGKPAQNAAIVEINKKLRS